MKRIVFILGVVAILAGCRWDAGERTVFWDSEGKVTITRAAQSDEFDNGNWQTAACIAVPVGWSAPITVTASGTHQVGGATTPFEITPEAFADGVTEMNTRFQLQDYDWQCFTDIARDYAETDGGQIQFTVAPESEVATVFTTMGVVSSSRSRDEHYYGNLATHQLLASDTYADHWQRVNPDDIETLSAAWPTFDTAEGTLVFNSAYDRALGDSALYRLTDAGLEQLPDMPVTNSLQYVNGLYVSRYNYSADIDGNYQGWTDVSYSSDLQTWSSPVTLNSIAEIQWDPRDQQYVAIINDYFNPQVNATYQSTDLVNWTTVQWIDRQSPTVAFLADGTAVLDTDNPSDPYWIRDVATDDWASLDIAPADGISGAVWFQVFMLESRGNRLHTKALRKIDGVNDKVLYGYSDNGTDWIWSEIGDYSDVGLTLNLIYLSDTTFLYSTTNAVMLTQDSGSTWQSMTKPASLLNSDTSSELYRNTRIDTISAFGDTFVGTSWVSTGTTSIATMLFKTQDFVSYELLTISSDLHPVTALNQLHIVESGTDGLVVQSLTPAAPDNDDDGISDSNDSDDDNDGVEDAQDAFPLNAAEAVDTDGDGVGNNADSDDDGDGVADSADAFPLDPSKSAEPVVQGSGGGGALGIWTLLLLMMMAVTRNRMRYCVCDDSAIRHATHSGSSASPGDNPMTSPSVLMPSPSSVRFA